MDSGPYADPDLKNGVSVLVLVLFILLLPEPLAAGEPDPWFSKAVSVQGVVQAQIQEEEQWITVHLGDTFHLGDTIRVMDRSRAAFLLRNETLIRLDQNTVITFIPDKTQNIFFELLEGAVHFFTRTPRFLKIRTPFVNAAVEGTEFVIRVEEGRTSIQVFEGRVVMENPQGSLTLTRGEAAVTEAEQAPSRRTVVRPIEGVTWALYYPPVLHVEPEGFPELNEVLSSYRRGDYTAAFEGLEPLQDAADPRIQTVRAALLLAVGRAEEARQAVEYALQMQPGYGPALAQSGVISLVQNDLTQAETLSRRAVAASPNSVAARLSRSFVHQGRFDLESALAEARKGVDANPQSALAWARLSELLLAMGETDKSLAAAERAQALEPDLARTNTVLGFAQLARFNTKEAAEAFIQAIQQDQADPLPRLGLGLAEIRQNRLAEGRQELEIAAGLSPASSIVRSYLGKAYFAENRNELALDQFDLAKEYDPADPTPWFYEAFVLQSMNRPAEALLSLKESMERNENRAVYRSRLLLDKDLASRSSSLAWIYDELGFEQLALKEGWQSVNEHPANFSAHRVLADTYDVMPRHEIARVSEELQARLLQPVTVNPVLPSLSEPELFIFQNTGPMAPGFNEFNPLFQRDGVDLLASGIAGGDDTWGDEVVLSGVHGGLSFSLGQFHYETDGFRENNDLEEDIANVFLQYAPTAETSVQAEFRYKELEKGDLPLRFDRDLAQNIQQEEERRTFRMGLHHEISPRSNVLGTVAVQKQEFDDTLSVDDLNGNSDIDVRGFHVEAQHLFHSRNVDTVSGAGHFNASQEEETQIFQPFFFMQMEERFDTSHENIYFYTLLDGPLRSTFTLGGSFDWSDGVLDETEQFNPKFGAVLTPVEGTTFHGGVIRNLQRSTLNGQTIEPTQVAGFSQFFDDEPGSDTWLYGLGVHHRFSQKIYGGVKGYHREIALPFESLENGISAIDEVYWEEEVIRAYLDWILHPWLTAEAAYLFEEFDRAEEMVGSDLFTRLTTHQGSLGFRFFHPSGFRAGITGYRVYQEGIFGEPRESLREGNDTFWLADASVGYLLPNRHGLLSLEVKNLFDTDFQYQSTDPDNPRFYPDLLLLGRVTLRF